MNVLNVGDRYRCVAHHWATSLKMNRFDEFMPTHLPLAPGRVLEIVHKTPDLFVLSDLHYPVSLFLVQPIDLQARFRYESASEAKPSRGSTPR